MRVHKNLDVGTCHSVVQDIKQEINLWSAFDVILEGESDGGALYPVVHAVCEHFLGQHKGEIFICGKNEFLTLVRAQEADSGAMKKAVHSAVAPFGASAQFFPLTDQGLSRIQQKLQDVSNAISNANVDDYFDRARKNRETSKVFVVDPDINARHALITILGQKVISFQFTDVQAAIEAYLKEAPDMVYVAIDPEHGVDGLRFLERIKAYDERAYIVLQTDTAFLPTIVRAKALGANGFLAKPFSPEKALEFARRCPTFRR